MIVRSLEGLAKSASTMSQPTENSVDYDNLINIIKNSIAKHKLPSVANFINSVKNYTSKRLKRFAKDPDFEKSERKRLNLPNASLIELADAFNNDDLKRLAVNAFGDSINTIDWESDDPDIIIPQLGRYLGVDETIISTLQFAIQQIGIFWRKDESVS